MYLVLVANLVRSQRVKISHFQLDLFAGQAGISFKLHQKINPSKSLGISCHLPSCEFQKSFLRFWCNLGKGLAMLHLASVEQTITGTFNHDTHIQTLSGKLFRAPMYKKIFNQTFGA